MPELPEVETVKRYLERNVLNYTFKQCEVLWKKVIDKTSAELTAFLQNETILGFERYGKYLVFVLTHNKAIISHFRMEGRFYIRNYQDDNSPHPSAIFYMNNNVKIIFDDSRKFGVLAVCAHSQVKNYPGIKKLGPELWDIKEAEFESRIKAHNRQIKKVLLDQEVVAGIGNIYADEINFKTGIHPKTLSRNIPSELFKPMLKNARDIMTEAIKQNGTQVKTFTASKDMPPHFQNELVCYGRVDLPCVKCGRPLKKTEIGGRGTTYCPYCQKNFNRPLVLGITGLVLSGKTTVLQAFSKKGYPTFNADTEVANAYKNLDIRNKIAKILNVDESKINKGLIRKTMDEDIVLFRQIEAVLHEYVKKQLLVFIKENKTACVLACEIPLLFKAEMESMFDFIVGVNISTITQRKRLETRPSMTENHLALYNKENNYLSNLKSVDFVINTDETKSDIIELEVQSILKNIL